MKYLTYQDINGKRRPRRYVISSGVILLGLTLLAWLWPSASPLITSPPPDGLIQQGQAQPAQSIRNPTQTAVGEIDTPACPENVEDWTMIEIFPGDHYRKIREDCIYGGVARTAAWMLAERMGFSKPEAAEVLGFDELPFSPEPEVEAYANMKGPTMRKLNGEWPAHPDFNFWQVDREGNSAVVISLRGCYILEGSAYCVLAVDRSAGSAVNVLGAHQFASHAGHLPAVRSFHLLKYKGDHIWKLVGQFSDVSVEITNYEQTVLDREQISHRLGVEPWDSRWLQFTYGLSMKPLPEGWRMLGMNELAVQTISDELNRFIAIPSGDDDA